MLKEVKKNDNPYPHPRMKMTEILCVTEFSWIALYVNILILHILFSLKMKNKSFLYFTCLLIDYINYFLDVRILKIAI